MNLADASHDTSADLKLLLDEADQVTFTESRRYRCGPDALNRHDAVGLVTTRGDSGLAEPGVALAPQPAQTIGGPDEPSPRRRHPRHGHCPTVR